MLNPTDDELMEAFWYESTAFDDDVKPIVDNVAFEDDDEKKFESDDAPSIFNQPQCPKISKRPSMSSHQYYPKTIERTSPTSYYYIAQIVK